ncbi:unnamed protein product [Adineta ricciae]|uniref:Uncharacterized protein n=1 Tax=Adineta ricciae TaxID=249248 RepID=A0A816G7Z1_ADIRI|nr:unnamed protein product [Adineta ricciae]
MSSSDQNESSSTIASPSTSSTILWQSTINDRRMETHGVHVCSSVCSVDSSDQRCMTQAPSCTTNQGPQLQVHSDISVTTSHGIISPCEALAEEELIERLKEIINQFMTRPDRKYSYDATMRWTIDHGNEINYSVVIFINQPSDLF